MGIKQNIIEIADRLDLLCEDANCHDFILIHRALAVLLVKEITLERTLAIFRVIEKESDGYGLPGLIGSCGVGPDENFLDKNNIPDNWSKWDL